MCAIDTSPYHLEMLRPTIESSNYVVCNLFNPPNINFGTPHTTIFVKIENLDFSSAHIYAVGGEGALFRLANAFPIHVIILWTNDW